MIDAESFLHIPAFWDASMSGEEWGQVLDNMITRTVLTRDFIEGRITPDQFGDVLSETGINVIQVAHLWEDGIYIDGPHY